MTRLTSAPAVAVKGDDEVESGALLAPSDHVHQAAPPPPQPSRLRFAHRCAARIVCAAIVFMVYVAALPLIGTLYYRAALMVGSGRWKAVPPCLPSEATTAIETQIAAACQRLNRAGAEYWLDRETLVAVTNEPNQRVFKHSSNADIAYMRRDHAKVVGALKSHDSLGEYYRYAHFDRGFLGHFDTKWKYAVGKGVAGQAWKFAIGLHSAAELSEKSERTENGRFALAVGDGESESLHIPWNVFPLRKLGGSGKLAHCSIPNFPFQYSEERGVSRLYWPRLVESFLSKHYPLDYDVQPCSPATKHEYDAFVRSDAAVSEENAFARSSDSVATPDVDGEGAMSGAWWHDAAQGAARRADAAAAAARAAEVTSDS